MLAIARLISLVVMSLGFMWLAFVFIDNDYKLQGFINSCLSMIAYGFWAGCMLYGDRKQNKDSI